MNLLLVAFVLCGSKTLPVAPPLLPDWSFLTDKDFDQVCGMCGISILRCDTNTHMNSPADISLTDGTFFQLLLWCKSSPNSFKLSTRKGPSCWMVGTGHKAVL